MPADLLQNPRARAHQSLDGAWPIIVDPYESGRWGYQGGPAAQGYFLDRRAAPGSDELVEYDFDASPRLQVPGDWNTQRVDLELYEGCVWYRRRFAATPAPGRRQLLRFEAVNERCWAWLNGEALGEHQGGFTPFEFEVTGRLRAGDNSLVLLVDNRRRREGVPPLQTDWWNYGGITRSVLLLDLPSTFIRDYGVGLGTDGGVQAWAQLDGPASAGVAVALELPGLRAAATAVTDASGRCQLSLPPSPGLGLWSPASPRLHAVALASPEDRVEDAIALRSIQARGADILLNGEAVFLRGVSLHEEAPGPAGGRPRSPAEGAQLLAWAKELGCNFVRLAHYPHDESLVRAAERLGLMVWEEIPVYWTVAWEDADAQALAQAQLQALIRRDRNRGAVILWSIGNETPPGEARLRFMAGLAATARALDPSRLVTVALEQHGGERRVVEDPLGAHLDVLGLNEYIGWYDGPPERCRRTTFECAWDKPLIVSELGADAKAGLHGGEAERWTEEYQAWVYREQLAMLGRVPNLRGMAPWILKDFRSPRRPLPGIQDGWNRKGLLSELGAKKLAWGVLQAHYRGLAGA